MNELNRLCEPSWIEEVRLVQKVYEEVKSVRKLAAITGRHKTWIGDSLVIAKFLPVIIGLSACKTRHDAMEMIAKYKQRASILKRIGLA